jgi:prophage regulatory protein
MRILRFKQMHAEKVPLSRAQVDRLEADGKFPKRVSLGPKSVGWLEPEIDEWVEKRAAERGEAA